MIKPKKVATTTKATAATAPKKSIVVVPYAKLKALLQSSKQPPRLPFDVYDKFQFAATDNNGTHHRYDPTRYFCAGPWLVERCTADIVVLALETFALRKFAIAPVGAMATKVHVTVVPAMWDRSGEFHVTSEKVVKSKDGFYTEVICSEFYRIDRDQLVPIQGKTSRVSCSNKSNALQNVSDFHAQLFVATFFYR
jgi:hypothetical protein